MTNTKECTKCKKSRDLNDFNKNKSSKDGLSAWCKLCVSEYQKENKQSHRERTHKYYLRNKEKVARRNRAYRESLTDSYIVNLLTTQGAYRKNEITSEIIEKKRLQIKQYRLEKNSEGLVTDNDGMI